VPIARVQASNNNNIAWTAHHQKPYLWGSNYKNKLGINSMGRNWEQPKPVIWQILKKSKDTANQSDDEEVDETQLIMLKTIVKDDDFFKKKKATYLSTIKSAEWGESHGCLLDKKGRVFTMGRSLNGVLGHSEEETDEIIVNPTQVQLGANHELPNQKVSKIRCSRFHTTAVTVNGNIYSWGEGADCRLGLGYIQETQSTPNQLTPYQLENVFDSNKIVAIGCGEKMSAIATHPGTVYTWGKGEHEKPKFSDYLEYSSPFVILEQKQIQYLAFGRAHVMALDKFGKLHAWGLNTYGCLGFGDPKHRATPGIIPFFEASNFKVIDVNCGDGFTVCLVQVDEGDQTQYAPQLPEFKSNRNPIASENKTMGADVRAKLRTVLGKNHSRYGARMLNMQSCLEMDNLSLESDRYTKSRRASTKDKQLELPEIAGATSPREGQ
jgi:alpha-tubulin suppressor-like RCC1 family protein